MPTLTKELAADILEEAIEYISDDERWMKRGWGIGAEAYAERLDKGGPPVEWPCCAIGACAKVALEKGLRDEFKDGSHPGYMSVGIFADRLRDLSIPVTAIIDDNDYFGRGAAILRMRSTIKFLRTESPS